MGQYWMVVNLDKREFVKSHTVGAGLKLWEQLAAHPGTGGALIVLCAAMPEPRGGGDFDLDENWHGPERTFPTHNVTPGPMPEPYPTIAKRTIDTLSGDEWQRLRLARALAQGGDAIVLDEPTTFLDSAHEMAAFELLHGLAAEGQAVLLVSHQLNLVARFAQWIVLLHAGRVAATGTPDEVMQAAVLERVYEWPLVVTRDPAVGAPALLPLRARRKP